MNSNVSLRIFSRCSSRMLRRQSLAKRLHTERSVTESSALLDDQHDWSETGDDVVAGLNRYSKFQPTPVSIEHFIKFGKLKDMGHSYLFLKRELPVRLANIMKELQYLPQVLRNTVGCHQISQLYIQSFKDILRFEDKADTNLKNLEDFTQMLIRIRSRHDNVVNVMATAALEVKERFSNDSRLPKFEKNIQYFLDRLYTNRISVRMLINQHTVLFRPTSRELTTTRERSSLVGAIDTKCKILPIIRHAYEDARYLAEQYYIFAPELRIRSFDYSEQKQVFHPSPDSHDYAMFMAESGVSIDDIFEPEGKAKLDDVECVYVPSHLHHILFELLKNAMRATVEFAGEHSTKFSPIEVLVVKSAEDVTIRISDRGGGIPKRYQQKAFDYLYTTAPSASKDEKDGSKKNLSTLLDQSPNQLMDSHNNVPLAGYGYGLPLSRLYARYFAGDLELVSTDGYGTEASVYLQAIPNEAKERLPVYNQGGSKKIYEAHMTPNDWTTGNDM